MASASAIATWLTESQGLSASWLAMNVGCGVEDARVSLEKYFEENKADENLNAKFVLSGEKKRTEEEEGGFKEANESRLFLIVDSKDMEQARSNFQESTCASHLYSLHSSTSAGTIDQLALAALQQTSDYLGSEAKTNIFVENMSIKPSDLQVKPIGKRINAAVANYTLETMKGPSYVSNGDNNGNSSSNKSSINNKETSVSNFFAKTDKINEKVSKEKWGSSVRRALRRILIAKSPIKDKKVLRRKEIRILMKMMRRKKNLIPTTKQIERT